MRAAWQGQGGHRRAVARSNRVRAAHAPARLPCPCSVTRRRATAARTGDSGDGGEDRGARTEATGGDGGGDGAAASGNGAVAGSNGGDGNGGEGSVVTAGASIGAVAAKDGGDATADGGDVAGAASTAATTAMAAVAATATAMTATATTMAIAAATGHGSDTAGGSGGDGAAGDDGGVSGGPTRQTAAKAAAAGGAGGRARAAAMAVAAVAAVAAAGALCARPRTRHTSSSARGHAHMQCRRARLRDACARPPVMRRPVNGCEPTPSPVLAARCLAPARDQGHMGELLTKLLTNFQRSEQRSESPVAVEAEGGEGGEGRQWRAPAWRPSNRRRRRCGAATYNGRLVLAAGFVTGHKSYSAIVRGRSRK